MNRRHFFERLAALMAAPAGTVPSPAIDPLPPVDFPPWLAEWRSLPRQPVESCDDPLVRQVIAAARIQRPLLVRYLRGSTPGEERPFTPALVFQTADHPGSPLYVNGWCHKRRQHRTLRLDHLVLSPSPHETSPPS